MTSKIKISLLFLIAVLFSTSIQAQKRGVLKKQPAVKKNLNKKVKETPKRKQLAKKDLSKPVSKTNQYGQLPVKPKNQYESSNSPLISGKEKSQYQTASQVKNRNKNNGYTKPPAPQYQPLPLAPKPQYDNIPPAKKDKNGYTKLPDVPSPNGPPPPVPPRKTKTQE